MIYYIDTAGLEKDTEHYNSNVKISSLEKKTFFFLIFFFNNIYFEKNNLKIVSFIVCLSSLISFFSVRLARTF